MIQDLRNRNSDGFTLSEMLVVLAILAIAATLALPGARQPLATQEFNSFSRSLAGLLREARLQAISQNRDAAVSVDFKQRVASLDDQQSQRFQRRIAIPQSLTVAAVTARGDISADRVTFRFFADGGATGGQIKLTSGSLARSIDINWLTGNISLTDGSRP